jgi:hypothetical protein
MTRQKPSHGFSSTHLSTTGCPTGSSARRRSAARATSTGAARLAEQHHDTARHDETTTTHVTLEIQPVIGEIGLIVIHDRGTWVTRGMSTGASSIGTDALITRVTGASGSSHWQTAVPLTASLPRPGLGVGAAEPTHATNNPSTPPCHQHNTNERDEDPDERRTISITSLRARRTTANRSPPATSSQHARLLNQRTGTSSHSR